MRGLIIPLTVCVALSVLQAQKPSGPPNSGAFELADEKLGETFASFVSQHPAARCTDSTANTKDCYQWGDVSIFGMAARPEAGCSLDTHSAARCAQGLTARFEDQRLILLSYAVVAGDKTDSVTILKKKYGNPVMDTPEAAMWISGDDALSVMVRKATEGTEGPTLTKFMIYRGNPWDMFLELKKTIILSMSGRVTNAVTGNAVRDMNVELQVSDYEGFSVHVESIGRSSTDGAGSFLLPETPISLSRSYWLIVNQPEGGTGQEEGSAATQIFYNPMFNRRGQPVGNKKYFPETITFRRDGCDLTWKATCAYHILSRDLLIPVIPILDNVKDCKKIENSDVGERCRQLNTYRSAFVHVDSYEEVQKGKKLCEEVDQGRIAKTCLDQLALYVANTAFDRPMKPQVNEPIPPGVFPDTLAGVPIIESRCGPRLEFSGRVMCGAAYGTKSNFLVSVQIEEWPGSAQTLKANDWKPQYTDHDKATVSAEDRPGGKVLRYRGPQYNSFFWFSGDQHVEVFFYHPIPELEQFVSFYLKRFPTTPQ